MSMNINGFGAGSDYSYKSTDTKSKQYKAAAKDHLAALMEEESMMTPEQRKPKNGWKKICLLSQVRWKKQRHKWLQEVLKF